MGCRAPAGRPFPYRAGDRRLSLYSDDGVRRIPAALRYAAGLFGALVRRRRRYAAVVVSGLPIFNVFAARLALLGSGTRLAVDYLEVWHRRQWVEYSGVVTGTIAWVLQRAAIAVTPLATCHSSSRPRVCGVRGCVARPSSAPGSSMAPPRWLPPRRPRLRRTCSTSAGTSPTSASSSPGRRRGARKSLPDLRLVVLGTGPAPKPCAPRCDASAARSGQTSRASSRMPNSTRCCTEPSPWPTRHAARGTASSSSRRMPTALRWCSSPTRATPQPNSSTTASTASSPPPPAPPISPGPSGTSPRAVTTCGAQRAPGTTPPSALAPSAAPWTASSRRCRCRAPPR